MEKLEMEPGDVENQPGRAGEQLGEASLKRLHDTAKMCCFVF